MTYTISKEFAFSASPHSSRPGRRPPLRPHARPQLHRAAGVDRPLTLHGYPCALQMGPYSINGYITLPADHPWLQGDPTIDPTIDVHGGITYHRGTTIGFDTNHHTDGYHPDSPGYQHAMKHGLYVPHAPHWTWQEARTELARLAEQAREIEKEN